MIRLITLVVFGIGGVLGIAVNWTSDSGRKDPVDIDVEDDREELWKAVDDAVKKGLPKTAISNLEKIIAGAMQDKAHAEAVHATMRKFVLQGNIEGNPAVYVVRQLQKETPDAPQEMQPVMRALLADWLYGYFLQNRWRFQQRSQTAAPPSEDFETWDLTRLLAEIDQAFTDALSNREELKKIPISQYDALLDKGNVDDSFRPTLFDFLAFRAIAFYSLDENFIRPQGSFDLTADSPIFSAVNEFVQWSPQSADPNSSIIKTIQLYQELYQFHREDENPNARLDVDLSRLSYGYQQAFGSEKAARFMAALTRFAEAHADHERSSLALAMLAAAQMSEKEMTTALETAQQGMARHKDSAGARQCYNIIQQIKAKSASSVTERVWNKPWPAVDVTYRNVDKVFFRLVPFDFEKSISDGRYSPEQLDHKKRMALLRRKPVWQGSADLPATDDYLQRTESVTPSVDAPPGSYFLLTSHNQRFSEKNNQVSMCEVWVSDLAIVLRNQNEQFELQGMIVNAITGKPVAEAKIRSWYRDHRANRLVELPRAETDESGMFSVPAKQNGQHVMHVTYGDHQLSSLDQAYVYDYNRHATPQERTVFFTDRAIYRPGQTIHFKGICIYSDTNKNEYKTLSNKSVRVALFDANNQEVEQRNMQSNEFGSFSGSFTAPRDRVTGQMQVRVIRGPHGMSTIRMEEYKRPKFYVELETPAETVRLNEKVSVAGTATAFTGAPIDGAKVTWRVARSVHYPIWWYWRCWWLPQNNETQEIAHGTATTDITGKFEIDFIARPDLSVPRESEPTFRYMVYADVTDTAGETRSDSKSVNVGYTTMTAELNVDDWQTTEKPVEVKLATKTLNGEGTEATGTLRVFRLQSPDEVQRGKLLDYSRHNYRASSQQHADTPPPADLSTIRSWSNGQRVIELEVSTDGAGNETSELELGSGAYRATFETKDRLGQKVTAEIPFIVLDPDARRFDVKIPHMFVAQSWTVEPGNEFVGLWGTGYESGQAYVELVHRGKILQSYWTRPRETQNVIRFPVSEEHRGGFHIRVTYVRENRAYLESKHVNVPWSSKQLEIKWDHFVSKLQPNSRESWTAVLSGTESERIAAEMVAGLYDASLDLFAPHSWLSSFNVFYNDYSHLSLNFQNRTKQLQTFAYGWSVSSRDGSLHYRRFRQGTTFNGFDYGVTILDSSRMYYDRYGWGNTRGGGRLGGRGRASSGMVQDNLSRMEMAGELMEADGDAAGSIVADEAFKTAGQPQAGGTAAPDIDLTGVSARKNLIETAFFFPHLTSDEDGNVRIEFTMPEALTKWKFLGFAHDADLRTALLTDEVISAKDLMVQPNPPRFLREGDVLEFSVKVSNQSATRQSGQVRLTFADARTGDSADSLLDNGVTDQPFELPSGQSTSLFWKIAVPDYNGVLTYKAVGATDRLSDGEEGMVPVISRRILVTESLPLPIRGPETKEFDFERLALAGKSDTLQSQTLTVQVTSNPAWYAVMALPYLMEYPHQCSEQIFNRLYANGLARHIANSDPKIRDIFDRWRGTDALDSPLEKNQDLKAVMIEESPWLRDAKAESQARRDVGILFDQNRLDAELARALNQLKQQQYNDGSWPWFPGGRANDYITLYIVTGFGRMRHLGVEIDVSPAIKALPRLDSWIDGIYQNIINRKLDRNRNHLNPTICLYLYGRSFFLKDQQIQPNHKAAVDFFTDQARKYWLKLPGIQSQGHLAIALKRFGDLKTAGAIMDSLDERSVNEEELGMYWRRPANAWWWYHAPIETQALMIEAFDEVKADAKAVEDLKVWLLKQKQTQNWKTTKATADAVYAILLRGTELLTSTELVKVTLGDMKIEPENVEAGTGFYQQRFLRGEIKPEMGAITVEKTDKGVAWGSVHWQYLEDMSKVEPYEGTPLTLKKSLHIKKNTEQGPVISEVEGPVQVGDELVARIELRVDRDMEYVHLKDYRGSGTEPVNVLSQYKYQDALAYYESTRDTASHFFIDYLPRGTYVFEYSVRVQHRGNYQTGVAQIQCMYAPEFNSHSGSVEITVE